MIRNKYKVQKKQWSKWSRKRRAMFNIVNYTMLNNQELFKHPKDTGRNKEFWKTTAWNAAWIAGGEMDWINSFCEDEE